MSTIRKVIFSLILFQSVQSFGQNEKYDSMKYSFLPKYEIYDLYFDNPRSYPSIKTDHEKKDSLNLINHPKHIFYFNFFNPYSFGNIKRLGYFNFDHSFLRKENKYWCWGLRHVHNRNFTDWTGLYSGYNFQYVYFSHMHRFTTKLDWLNFDLDYGIILGRNDEFYNTSTYRVRDITYGAGPSISFEIQFNVGNWGNISLKSHVAYLLGQRNYSVSLLTSPQDNLWTIRDFDQHVYPYVLSVGFNIYLKNKL